MHAVLRGTSVGCCWHLGLRCRVWQLALRSRRSRGQFPRGYCEREEGRGDTVKWRLSAWCCLAENSILGCIRNALRVKKSCWELYYFIKHSSFVIYIIVVQHYMHYHIYQTACQVQYIVSLVNLYSINSIRKCTNNLLNIINWLPIFYLRVRKL